MTKTLKFSLLVLFLFQVFITIGFELVHDEAYYWIYSRHLDWGFFDHPPAVGVVIKLFSFLPHSEFSVRIGFVVLQFASLIILLTLTGFQVIPVLLFFSFPLASYAGLLALPDMPLLFMSACYCLLLKKYLEKDSLQTSLWLGLCIALLFYAKYHGVLLVFFTILAVPKLLTRKSFYFVSVISFIAFLPHLLWQYQHDFSTLRYHFLERPSSHFSWSRSLEYIGQQVFSTGLLVGPILWWSLLKYKTQSLFERAMKFIFIGTIIFFFISSFNKKIEANWTIFLAIPVIYLLSRCMDWKEKWKRWLLGTSFIIVVLARILLVLPANDIPIKRLKEFNGWKAWAKEVEKICAEDVPLANSYQIAAKLSYYLKKDIGSLNYHSRKNQFDYWKFEQKIPTNEVCYITDKVEFKGLQILTPEGKTMRIIKNQSLDWLLKLKYQSTR